jgi:PHD/YefM family antitoxin component YafN of YafNO toxin-antitoxin module
MQINDANKKLEKVVILIIMILFSFIWYMTTTMTISTISSREAKLHFWMFLDTVQRWPTIVTKNKRPVGIMISIEDAKKMLIGDYFLPQEEWYEGYFHDKVSTSLQSYLAGENPTISHQESMDTVWNKIFA